VKDKTGEDMTGNENLRKFSEKDRRRDIITYAIMLAFGLIFYFVPGTWIGMEEDSLSYLALERREGVLPGYIAFLSFFKVLFSEEYFLHGVVIAQSFLAIGCTFLFVWVLKKRFNLKGWECILFYLFSMLPFSIYLPEVGITHQILTEGITYAIFYLFIITVLEAVWTLKYKWYLGSMAVAVLLGLIRSQMLFLQVVCLLVLLWITFKRFGGKLVLKLVAVFFILAVGIVLAMGIKIKAAASQFASVIIARGFYEADEEDVELYDDVMMQEIFRKTYKLADENEALHQYAEPGLYMWEDLVHDDIKFYASQALKDYYAEHPDAEIRNAGDIFFELGFKELMEHFDRYLYHSMRLMMPSFIATVFFQIKPIYFLCHIITFFIYFFAIAGTVTTAKLGGGRKVIELMIVVLSVLVVMVVTVNMLFIGLQRYVVYGMGIFYCALYLLCREMAWCLCERSGKKWHLLKAFIGERV